MHHHLTEILASIIVVGVFLQWLGWRLCIPVLILLISAGFILGPSVTEWLDPSKEFGNMLQPMVSLAVAIILFEGGLNLQWHEFKQNGKIIYRLTSLNVLFMFISGSLAAHYLVGMDWPVALIFGAIIIVTGPTVIMPLLKQANLKKRPAALLRWEGIVNDPIGALLVVLIYSFYTRSSDNSLIGEVLAGLSLSLLVSLILGVGLGILLAQSFKRGSVPEYLKSPLILATVLLVYILANRVQSEAGLLATTILGITLANQKLFILHELKRSKEYVTILLVSATFIVLTANIDPAILFAPGWESWVLLGLVIFVFRPLSIYLSTIGSGIDWKERLLIAWIAPRGIVAAAVAGVFSVGLINANYQGAELLLPLVFALILLTVVLHGLSIGWLSRYLGLSSDKPEGVLMVGAAPWTIGLAEIFQKLDIPTLITDTSWKRLSHARMLGIPTHYGEILSERTEEVLELAHVTKLLTLTPNEAYNTLVCSRFAPELGFKNVYEIGWKAEDKNEHKLPSNSLRGRELFSTELDNDAIAKLYEKGWRFKNTPLSDVYTLQELIEDKSNKAYIIACIYPSGKLSLFPFDENSETNSNSIIITLSPDDTNM